MSLPVKTFRAGDTVRVEVDARIVAQVDHNPYYYVVEYQDGTQEQIYVERMHLVADKAKVLQDGDSLRIISNRLSASGALDLLTWLEIHKTELLAQIAANTTGIEEVIGPFSLTE